VKFQIRRELGAKPETSEEAKTSKYTPRLTEWLVRTLLLVSMEEYAGEQHHLADDNLRHVHRRRREASEAEGRKEGSTAGAEERAAAFKETGVVSKQ
jgi:hypothetical protein